MLKSKMNMAIHPRCQPNLHTVGASYCGLYEEGKVEHINIPPIPSLNS